MKCRPYRVCDICGSEYDKTHNCMKVKIMKDPYHFVEQYGDWPIMSKMDICPSCGEALISELKRAVFKRNLQVYDYKGNGKWERSE